MRAFVHPGEKLGRKRNPREERSELVPELPGPLDYHGGPYLWRDLNRIE